MKKQNGINAQRIFIMNGQGGAGKDTAVSAIMEYDKTLCNTNRIKHISMVGRAKEIAKLAGWTGAKDLKGRKFLSDLKTLLDSYNDCSFNYISYLINAPTYFNGERTMPTPYIFVDAREPDDIDRLKENFNCTTILIKRGPAIEFNNDADDNVFNYQYDIVIENNGTLEEFKESVIAFWDTIITEELTKEITKWETFNFEGELNVL